MIIHALAIAVALAAQPQPVASHAGVYSDVHLIPEAGDLLGMEVELRPGPKPVIVVTTCEGSCSGGKAWPVTITGDRIAFTVCEAGVDQNGKPVPCHPLHYSGTFRADGKLVLTYAGSDEKPEVLRRVAHPQPHQVEQEGCNADHC